MRLMAYLAMGLVLVLASLADAATYYVATTGNDTTGNGSIGTPWRTIQKAANTVVAGDAVIVRGGTYAQYITIAANGTAGNRITFQPYPGETAIIDGSGTTAPTSNTFLVKVEGDYITIKNFEVVNAAWMSIICWNTATQCIIDGNTVHHGYHAGIVFYQNTNNTAQNNHVYDMYDFNSGGGNGDCIDTSGNLTTSNHQFLNNVVHDCSDDGLDGWSSAGNTYIGNISYHNGYVPFTSTPAGNGNGYKLGGNGGGSHTLIDNVAWGNRVRGFEDNGGPNNKLYNNTAINNGTVNYHFVASGAILTNNISYGPLGSAAGALTTNSWQLGISNPSFIQITDPTLSTFARLSAGSPAINVGANVGGSSHICVGACDLGAFEYGEDSDPPAPPTGITIVRR